MGDKFRCQLCGHTRGRIFDRVPICHEIPMMYISGDHGPQGGVVMEPSLPHKDDDHKEHTKEGSQ